MWILGVRAQDKDCIQCATSNLMEDWGATGLPLKPANLLFDDKCGTPNSLVSTVSGNCASMCFELMIPVNNKLAFVRGCHADFVWDEFASHNESCHQYVDDVTVIKSGIAFCTPQVRANPQSPSCNAHFDDTNATASNCLPDAMHTCKSCSEFDGNGDCSASTTGTCKGVYCTKTAGKMNGKSYETRGCSLVNPIGSNVCSWTDQTFNISMGIDQSAAARKKRGVSLPFRANQCYCQGELCNSSPPSQLASTLLLSIFSTSILIFR
ncbi:DUF281 domain-containing protein [Caenorhabditis elegans]|uniref:DUF281 domain-containing protein n=1 Tax=Caenorhabditis elegans TaxID=6239 RepID=E1NZ05_CAEEL|nr:DUF281 domain-containing protein [Caenorhabditis elegans]CBX25202.1 DUF281 domain-containing protein [Caenorhabditis elegans]|eukprot:NP_001254329.1 Uncharacterized protein CELE_Y17G7B.23 [Caenorhabditis elegans]